MRMRRSLLSFGALALLGATSPNAPMRFGKYETAGSVERVVVFKKEPDRRLVGPKVNVKRNADSTFTATTSGPTSISYCAKRGNAAFDGNGVDPVASYLVERALLGIRGKSALSCSFGTKIARNGVIEWSGTCKSVPGYAEPFDGTISARGRYDSTSLNATAEMINLMPPSDPKVKSLAIRRSIRFSWTDSPCR